MEIYAAMIDHTDAGIGRVLDHLRTRQRLEDTIVVFLSDNGAAGGLRETNAKWGPWISANFDNSLANMGTGTSYVSTGPSWAQASMSPFALNKGFTTEGGTRSPVIVAGPGIPRGQVSGDYGDVRDLVPTILQATGTPAETPKNKAPLRGHSLVETIERPSAQLNGPHTPVVLEMWAVARSARTTGRPSWSPPSPAASRWTSCRSSTGNSTT